MMFMNTYEIDEARRIFKDHPALGPATQTLVNLRDAADSNSDGWAYWPKPARAARRLMELVEDARRALYRDGVDLPSSMQVKTALRPIKAFRTRSGIEFEIVEP